MTANPVRMERLTKANGAILMVPMDHGISMGPLPGLEQPAKSLEAVAGIASCVTLHKGMVSHAAPYARDLGILMHLSASTDLAADPNDKRVIGRVEEAVRAGCDGVSTHLNLGSLTEPNQLQEVARVSTACQEFGMPHIAMVYPRGPSIEDPLATDVVAHAARLGAEIGADAVKVPFTGDASFKDVVTGAGIPVIVAGGPARDFDGFLADLKVARKAGAAGVSIGRNVFQSPDPTAAIQAIDDIFS